MSDDSSKELRKHADLMKAYIINKGKELLESTAINEDAETTANEYAESFMNGNTSYVRDEIKNSKNPAGMAAAVAGELMEHWPEDVQRFINLMNS